MPGKSETRNQSRSPQGTVCVIDGDEGVRTSLLTLLETLPVKVVAFSSAEEFLDHVDSGAPSFLITEINLPGIGGFELLEVLRSRGIFLPAIAITVEASPARAREAARLGLLHLVEKPFVYRKVMTLVQDTLQVSA